MPPNLFTEVIFEIIALVNHPEQFSNAELAAVLTKDIT
jgi:hypothetical protein